MIKTIESEVEGEQIDVITIALRNGGEGFYQIDKDQLSKLKDQNNDLMYTIPFVSHNGKLGGVYQVDKYLLNERGNC